MCHQDERLKASGQVPAYGCESDIGSINGDCVVTDEKLYAALSNNRIGSIVGRGLRSNVLRSLFYVQITAFRP